MDMDTVTRPPPNVDTIEALADMHRNHHRKASLVQRLANQTASLLGRPGSFVTFMLLVMVWMLANHLAAAWAFIRSRRFRFRTSISWRRWRRSSSPC